MELNRSDHPYIAELAIGDSFDSFFILQTIQLATTRMNKPYLSLVLTDKSGSIEGKIWDDAESVYQYLSAKTVVKVRAGVTEYLGKLQLSIQQIRMIEDQDITDRSRFLPTADHPPEEDWETIERITAGIKHEGIHKLIYRFLNDEAFCRDFEQTPAGKKWHHGYIGGLLEHTASMMKLASRLCDHYSYLNRDLLIAGVFFHDIGKMSELHYDNAIDYTIEGRLIGHITMGASLVEKEAEQIEEMDSETTILLRHLVLSHQGARENGTPVLPQTREAFILYYLDEIDSKMNAINRELQKYQNTDEPFTRYINLLDRMLYKGNEEV